MAFSPLISLAVLAAVFAIWLFSGKSHPKGSARLPPGPKGLPLIGNLLSIPPYHAFLKFKEWANDYGPLYRLNLAGQNFVIISTEKIANDLLTKRGGIYSSRGGLIALSKVLLNDDGIISQPYNERLRRWRKFFHDVGRSEALGAYQTVQSSEAFWLVEDLVDKTEDYETVVNRFTNALTFRLAVGKPVITGKENYVVDSQTTLHNIEKAGVPGAYMVDIFPWMMHIPRFLAPWRRELEQQRDDMFKASSRNLNEVKRVYDNLGDDAPNCWTVDLLKNQSKYKFSHEESRMVIDTVVGAGSGTTAATYMSILLAMTLHQEWQTKAQEAIDNVIGNRIPAFNDMQELPIVRAIVKETLRWRPVSAGGVPHMSTEDDVYEGMFIPAGTNVIPNIWAIHREPSLYPDPDRFNPERWLSKEYPTFQSPLSEYPNLRSFSAFGFGRRLCPGLNFAEQSLYIATAVTLWACQITKKIDTTTEKEVPVPDFDFTTEGFNCQPKKFSFSVVWRDAEKERLTRQAAMETKSKNSVVLS